MPDGEVRIFDTTLRDGEQAPGIALTRAEKVEIAEQLARLNVDIIEAGFPVSGGEEFEAVREIAETVKGPVIAALARCNRILERTCGRRRNKTQCRKAGNKCQIESHDSPEAPRVTNPKTPRAL